MLVALEPGDRVYEWIEGWVDFAGDPEALCGWAHPGIAVAPSGVILTGHPATSTLLVYNAEGRLLRSALVAGVTELHGLRVAPSGERVWIADIGSKRVATGVDFETRRSPEGGHVVEIDLEGRTVRSLPRPGLAVYGETAYAPTSVVVDDEAEGGSGDIWVGDGYGAGLVHRFDADGRYKDSLTGEEGVGRFSCPHGLLIDRRKDEPELYVTDRGNSRIQVFDLAGRFKRVVGEGVLTAPTEMTTVSSELVLTDFMRSRLTVLDREDQLVGHLGENPGAPEREGWPNERSGEGCLVRPRLDPGRFNSPHAVAADSQGNLYVTEWLFGGRYTKLLRR